MVSVRQWRILNVSLAFLALLLLLPLLGIRLPSLGQAELWLNPDDPRCLAQVDNEFSGVEISRCCLLAAQQLSCHKEKSLIDGQYYDWACQTGQQSVVQRLNHVGYQYCTLQPFWGRR